MVSSFGGGKVEHLRDDVKNLRRSLTVIWCFFLFPQVLLLGAWGFLLSLNHDWFTCQLQRAEFLWKGSHEGPLFRMFPLLLQTIISNQMKPWRLRGAWFSRLLRHPARRRSGYILSPGTHTGFTIMVVWFCFSPGHTKSYLGLKIYRSNAILRRG